MKRRSDVALIFAISLFLLMGADWAQFASAASPAMFLRVGEPLSEMKGDLNGDGSIDILDIQLCVNVALGTEDDPTIVQAADVNEDGVVNVLDVQLTINIFLFPPPTPIPTQSVEPTATETSSPTQTATPTFSPTPIPTFTSSPTPTFTSTSTPLPPTPTSTLSSNPQPTATPTPVQSDTPLPSMEIELYQTLELVFTASLTPSNPFDSYLLKLEITDPEGNSFTIDGFFDGDGKGSQEGQIWKARLCPYAVGSWTWRTVPGDVLDNALIGLNGKFNVIDTGNSGGIVADGRYFRLQSGEFIYLVGNFLDFADGLRTTHTFMSETTSDAQRDAIIARQRDFHTANKANIYFANRGDYGSQSVTPWLGNASSNDKTRMDLARWKLYDEYILRFGQERMLAEMWFFADDSGFGSLSEANRNRLIRYVMARTSAFSHTSYVIALEWQEGFTVDAIRSMGDFIKLHNPWGRLISVHSLSMSSWEFAGEAWADFIASQAGNDAGPSEVNSYAISMRAADPIPHVDEEFGILNSDNDAGLRANLWANFAGGAAGSGTGSDIRALQRFIGQSGIPFQRMTPANNAINGGGNTRFVLAEAGHHYLAYSSGGGFSLSIAGTGLSGQWFNPRDPNASLGAPFPVDSGTGLFTPPSGSALDWVLWITDSTDLSSGTTHSSPSSDPLIVEIETHP